MCERIPYPILLVRQLSQEPFGSRKRYELAVGQAVGPVSDHPPNCRERAVWQDVGVSRTARRSNTGNRQAAAGPPQNHPSNRRTSRRARRRARLEPSAEAMRASRQTATGPISNRTISPEQYKQAVGQATGPVSAHSHVMCISQLTYLASTHGSGECHRRFCGRR